MSYESDVFDLVARARRVWKEEYDELETITNAGNVSASPYGPVPYVSYDDERRECSEKIDKMEERLLKFTEGSDNALANMLGLLAEQRAAMAAHTDVGDLILLSDLLRDWSGPAADSYRFQGGAELPQIWANQVAYLDGLIATLGGWHGLFTSARDRAKEIAKLAGDRDSGGDRNLFFIGAAVLAGIAAFEMPALAAATLSVASALVASYPPEEQKRNEYDISGNGIRRIDKAIDALDELLTEVEDERTEFRSTVGRAFSDIPDANIILGRTTTYHEPPTLVERTKVAVDIANLWMAGQKVFPHLAVAFELAIRELHRIIDSRSWAAFNSSLVKGGEMQWDNLCEDLYDALGKSRDHLEALGDLFVSAAGYYTQAEQESSEEIERINQQLNIEWKGRKPEEQLTLDDLPDYPPPLLPTSGAY